MENDVFHLVFKYFWAICIGAEALEIYVLAPLDQVSKFYDSERSSQLQALRHRVFGAMTLPWVVMGFGQLVGGIPTPVRFLRPQDLNPYVWAWYVSWFLSSCAFTYWIFVRDWVKDVVALNMFPVRGFRGSTTMSESSIKLLAAAAPLVAILLFVLLWVEDIPVIDFVR